MPLFLKGGNTLFYPNGKNLIPNFNDNRWFNDGLPTWAIRNNNPNSMNLTLATSANGRLIQIPVENGKTYTFSFGIATGLYRLYKRAVTTHDPALVLANHTDPGKPDTYTFTVDSTYLGFITIRLTYGGAGTFTFENLQLEEGSVKTSFEPYKPGQKLHAVRPKEVVMPTVQGTSHTTAVGNLIKVTKDIKLKQSQINVISTGSFNIAVYEWQEGVGKIGAAIFQKDITYNTTGIYTYDFGGLLLKAGKTYIIGRYSMTGAAGVARIVGGIDATPKDRFTLLGGTNWSDTSIAFATTYYYFYGLEIESTERKAAVLSPGKNYFSLDPANWTQGVRQGNKSIQASVYRCTYSGEFPKVTPGQKFVLDFPTLVPGYSTGHKFGVFVWDKAGNLLVDSGWQYGKYEFTIPANGYEMSLNMGLANDGSLVPSRAQVTQMVVYDKDKMINKPVVAQYPQKNLLPAIPAAASNISEIRAYNFLVDAPASGFSYIPFPSIAVEPNTQYTLSFKKEVYTNDIGVTAETLGGVAIANMSGVLPYTFNTGNNTVIRLRFWRILAAATKVRVMDWQLEKGTVATPKEDYRLGFKPAKLYPQKNYLQDTEKLDEAPLWIKENGVISCVKTGEKFKGANVYRVTFQNDNNGRVFQYFNDKGVFSASIWVKYIQYDTTLVLTLREQNFGISAGLTSVNQNIPEWQNIKLENAIVGTDKPYMFALYKSGKTQMKNVIVDIAMPQLEPGAKATDYELYKIGNKPL